MPPQKRSPLPAAVVAVAEACRPVLHGRCRLHAAAAAGETTTTGGGGDSVFEQVYAAAVATATVRRASRGST